MTAIYKFLTTIVLLVLNFNSVLTISNHPKLLVVSYDAFRYNYFDRNHTPYMKHLKYQGTYVDYMMNVFITKTFPNHHTMATGLYAETQGVVDNNMMDPVTGNVSATESYELFHYSKDVVPIWTVNEKAGSGRHSGTIMWPGSHYEYQNITPLHVQAFNHTIPWKTRIDTMISWFTDSENPINFGVLYIEEPDFHGHIIGINNDEFNHVLAELDNITQYLHDELDKNGLRDINVIHLSDHGMATVKLDRIINLTKYINDEDYKFFGTSPGLHIYPNPGKKEEIYNKLKAASIESKHFTVYKHDQIPVEYHYGNNPRVGSILVLAEVGYAFQNLLKTIESYKNQYNITVNNNSEFGLHGYRNDVPEMHPIFFAKGPAFLPKCKLEPFDNVNLFPLFCHILELDCPTVNGTIKHLNACLRIHDTSWKRTSVMLVMSVGLTIIVGTFAGFMVISMITRRYMRSNQGYRFHYDLTT